MSIEALNKQIKTTKDLRGIVNTMKLLSSVSVNQYNQAYESIKEYGKTIDDGFLALYVNGYLTGNAPKLPKKPKTLAVLIGSDNGLVGPFNKEVLSQANKYFRRKEIDESQVSYICVGKRISALARYQRKNVIENYIISNSLKEITSMASLLLSKINESIQKNRFNRVVFFHNQRMEQHQEVDMSQIYPLPRHVFRKVKERKWENKAFPLITADFEDLFKALVHEYLSFRISRNIIASLAAEHYTRMINMQQAEKNIDESLEKMNLEYQQARQTAITNELIDIVSGADSMKKKKKQLDNTKR